MDTLGEKLKSSIEEDKLFLQMNRERKALKKSFKENSQENLNQYRNKKIGLKPPPKFPTI